MRKRFVNFFVTFLSGILVIVAMVIFIVAFSLPRAEKVSFSDNGTMQDDTHSFDNSLRENVLDRFNQRLRMEKEVLLGSATTTFWGSSRDRIFNIARGAQKVSGVTVPPGEIYSFLKYLGDVSVATGYRKEYVISAGSTRKEAGGGICQVSTTLFRAALAAGLPIVERAGHGYVVHYYGPGLDATVYGPWRDLKFLNDTGHPITVKSYVKGHSISFEIWGIPDGRVATTTPVKITNVRQPPKPVYIPDFSLAAGKLWCTEYPVRGMRTEVTYTIFRPDGTKDQQKFITNYKPWGKRCYIGVKAP